VNNEGIKRANSRGMCVPDQSPTSRASHVRDIGLEAIRVGSSSSWRHPPRSALLGQMVKKVKSQETTVPRADREHAARGDEGYARIKLGDGVFHGFAARYANHGKVLVCKAPVGAAAVTSGPSAGKGDLV